MNPFFPGLKKALDLRWHADVRDRHVSLAVIALFFTVMCWINDIYWWALFCFVVFGLSVWRVIIHQRTLDA